MAEEHPLTNEIIDQIALRGGTTYDEDMRAAADWQLEQVKKSVGTKLSEWRTWSPDIYEEYCDHIDDFFHYVIQELRPQQQEDE